MSEVPSLGGDLFVCSPHQWCPRLVSRNTCEWTGGHVLSLERFLEDFTRYASIPNWVSVWTPNRLRDFVPEGSTTVCRSVTMVLSSTSASWLTRTRPSGRRTDTQRPESGVYRPGLSPFSAKTLGAGKGSVVRRLQSEVQIRKVEERHSKGYPF